MLSVVGASREELWERELEGVMGVNCRVWNGNLACSLNPLCLGISVEPMPFSALEDIKAKCQTLSLVSSDSIMWGEAPVWVRSISDPSTEAQC